jgi:hypothetical protein
MKKLISLILALITLTALCVPALADGGDYSMLGDWTGEVISRQVSLYNQANSSSGSSRKVANGVQFNILEKQGNWVHVEVPNNNGGFDTGWIMVPYIVENPTHIVLRSNSGIYAYAAPYNTDKRVGTVDNYQRFTVIATSGNYYIVSFREAVCYLPMNADYWVEEDLKNIVEGPYTRYYVAADNTKVYGYPSTNHGKIDTFKAGRAVDVFYTQDGFAAIRYNNVIAFIPLSDLRFN